MTNTAARVRAKIFGTLSPAAILAVCTFLVSACGPANNQAADQNVSASKPALSHEAELAAFKAAIRAKYDMKEQAFRDNDPEPILTKFYAADAISTDNEGVTHVGRDALRPVYEEVIGAYVDIESFDSFVRGDAGWDWVNFHVSFPPEAEMEPFTFKMLFLWERVDGEWWSKGEMYVMGEFDIP